MIRALLHFGGAARCQGTTDLQAATDEYIELNDDRFGEVAALLLKGRADLAAERSDSPAALALGEQGLHSSIKKQTMKLTHLCAPQDP